MVEAFDPFAKPHLIALSGRGREIGKLEKLYNGTQYDGRPDWWTGKSSRTGDEVPLRERKPCVIYRLPKAACQQVSRFLFGDGRFPKLCFEPNEGEEAADFYPTVSEAEAEQMETWLSDLVQQAQVKPLIQNIAASAIALSSAVLVIELLEGRFRFTRPSPQHCWAQFQHGDPSRDVERLVWCYEFDKEILDPATNLPTTKRYLFRREWDAVNVSVWDDVEVRHGVPVEWGPPKQTAHGLGFCPVLWFRNEAATAESLDGTSLIADLADEFEALDMTLSRRHQGIIYLGSPQIIETGVEPGDGPDASGRKASPVADDGRNQHGVKVATRARRIAPDAVWTYQGESVTVQMLETSGKAFEVATNHVNDIRSRILETMGVVLTSMADTVSRVSNGAEMSARFLALAHAPLISLTLEYREHWWPHGLQKMLDMLMRMVAVVASRGEVVMIPRTTEAAAVLARFGSGNSWKTPRITPQWGRFFEPSETEIMTTVGSAVAAKDGGLVCLHSAVGRIAQDFDIESVDEEIEQIESEAAEKLKADQEAMKAEFDAAANKFGSAGQNPGNGRPKDGQNNPDGKAGPGKPLPGKD